MNEAAWVDEFTALTRDLAEQVAKGDFKAALETQARRVRLTQSAPGLKDRAMESVLRNLLAQEQEVGQKAHLARHKLARARREENAQLSANRHYAAVDQLPAS